MQEDVKELYLDLMKKCLVNWIYGNEEYIEILPTNLNLLKRIIFELQDSRPDPIYDPIYLFT